MDSTESKPARVPSVRSDTDGEDDAGDAVEARDTTRDVVYAMMILYFPFLGMVCFVAIAVAMYFIVAGVNTFALLRPFVMAPGIFLGWTVIHVLISLPVLFERIPSDRSMEVKVPRQWINGLYRLVDDVARKWKLPRPDVIYLHAETIAHVYEDEDEGRVLCIGGVALASFTTGALSGVIAHELGHFAGGDTKLGLKGRRWHLVMGRLDYEFANGMAATFNPLCWALRAYHNLFRHRWAAHQREAEYLADRYEVKQAGVKQAARTTILLECIEELPWASLYNFAQTCVAAQIPMQRLFTEQARRARETSPDDWEDACRKAARKRTGPLDSHPCLKERVQAMGVNKKETVKIARRLNRSGPPASDLINNWDKVESRMSAAIIDLIREIYEAKMEFAQVMLHDPAV